MSCETALPAAAAAASAQEAFKAAEAAATAEAAAGDDQQQHYHSAVTAAWLGRNGSTCGLHTPVSTGPAHLAVLRCCCFCHHVAMFRYEAYGPGGTGFVIEALTDNVNRTAGGAV